MEHFMMFFYALAISASAGYLLYILGFMVLAVKNDEAYTSKAWTAKSTAFCSTFAAVLSAAYCLFNEQYIVERCHFDHYDYTFFLVLCVVLPAIPAIAVVMLHDFGYDSTWLDYYYYAILVIVGAASLWPIVGIMMFVPQPDFWMCIFMYLVSVGAAVAFAREMRKAAENYWY